MTETRNPSRRRGRWVLWWLLVGLPLVPALVLTALRARPPASSWTPQVVAFAPYAVPAYVVALLVLLVTRRRWSRLLAVPVAALLAVAVWWQAPLFTGPTPPPAAGATTWRVLTVNALRGEVDGLALVEAAADARAEVLVIQEITPGLLATMTAGGLGELYPHRAGEPAASTHGTMVFSRFPLGAATRLETEMASWQVEMTSPQGPITLVAVHAFPPTRAGQWTAELRGLAAHQGATVMAGDFNATHDHRVFRDLLRRTGLHDAAERANAGWQPTWPANGANPFAPIPLPPLVAIDHVLLAPTLAVVDTETLELDGTDHRGLLVEVAAT